MRFFTHAIRRCPPRLLLVVVLFAAPLLFAQPSAFHPEGDAPKWDSPPASETGGESSIAPTPAAHSPLMARIAQLMLVTPEGVTKPAANDLAFFKSAVPGGIVLPHAFKAGSAANYINILRALDRNSGTPLLIGTDLYQLTQATRDLPGSFVQLPSLLSITASGDSASVKSLGRLMAQQVLLMGFNFHFGPALELAPTMPDALATLQTFGSDPKFVEEAALLFHEAFTESGVLFMPAGFPGGGANKVGRGAAVLTTPLPLLLEQDVLPYRALIERGVKMLHVGNVLAPTLDDENRPASLSPAVMTDLLRVDLGFSGVIVAGPMDDMILQTRYDSGEAALQSLLAGADMLYWQGGVTSVLRAMARIEGAVKRGEISEERLQASIARISALKQSLNQPEKPLSDRQVGQQARAKDLAETSRRIEHHAITLLKNDNNVLPLAGKGGGPVGITGIAGVEELYKLLEKQVKPLARQRITTARHIGEIQRFEIERLTRHMQGLHTVICVLTDGVRVETQIELVRSLKANAPFLVVVYLGHPKHAAHLVDADAILIAYCEPVTITQTLQAMADILMGKAPVSIMEVEGPIRMRVGESRSFNAYEILRAPSGRLPLTLSERFPAGASARYNPATAVKRVEWDFSGRKTRKETVVHAFTEPGDYTVTLTVTDINNETQTKSFAITVNE